MNAQRREYPTPAKKAYCWGSRYCLRPADFAERVKEFGSKGQNFIARLDSLHARGETAPPDPLARLATSSLQLERRNTRLVRLALRSIGLSLAAPQGRPASDSRPVSVFRVILFAQPYPSGFAHFHPSSPQLPAAVSCRTERYDGKRNLYFQHAA